MSTQAQPVMSYNFLGKSGLKVSNLCLGAMTFGTAKALHFDAPTQADEQLSHSIMDRYFELGGNFIDTADVYSFGKSEEIIGSWLKKKTILQERGRVVIATKARSPTDPSNPNKVGLSRRHLIASCDDSLKRFQTEYIDLYQTHGWDSGTPLKETLRTLDDLVRCGKIRYFGVSNVCGWQMQKIVDLCESMGLNQVVSLQQQYSLLARNCELEEFEVCRNEGIAVLPWSPLKGGFLTGKFKKGEKPTSNTSRIGYLTATDNPVGKSTGQVWDAYADDDNYWHLIDLMGSIAKKHGKSIAQVALRWLLQQYVVASVIIGATSLQQLEDNMGAAGGWELTDEDMQKLNDASPLKLEYPYDILKAYNADRINKNT